MKKTSSKRDRVKRTSETRERTLRIPTTILKGARTYMEQTTIKSVDEALIDLLREGLKAVNRQSQW